MIMNGLQLSGFFVGCCGILVAGWGWRAARCGRALVMQLRTRVKELETDQGILVSRRTEEDRYSRLGEIAGLVIHDLSAPLHVIQFCVQELRENPNRSFDSRYLERLTVSGDRALELVSALRNYLRAAKATEGPPATFAEIHGYVVKILGTHFYGRGFERIRFVIDPALVSLRLAIPRPDLIHVLLNLLSNSVENLLAAGIPSPEITLDRVLGEANGSVTILVSDNGTGLSAGKFEELTASNSANASSRSLGLRLIRRLVEGHGGSLRVEDCGGGTSLRLQFKGEVFGG